mgnify:CR=1 FL=1
MNTKFANIGYQEVHCQEIFVHSTASVPGPELDLIDHFVPNLRFLPDDVPPPHQTQCELQSGVSRFHFRSKFCSVFNKKFAVYSRIFHVTPKLILLLT